MKNRSVGAIVGDSFFPLPDGNAVGSLHISTGGIKARSVRDGIFASPCNSRLFNKTKEENYGSHKEKTTKTEVPGSHPQKL